MANELFAVKEKKLREPEEKKELARTLKMYILCQSQKRRICSMYNKTIITIFGSYDIQNNQGLSYQPQPTPTLTLIILDIIKTSPIIVKVHCNVHLWTFELPGNISHDVYSVCSTHTNTESTKTT